MMKKTHFLDVIYTHTEGEPSCIVHSGIPYPPGLNILQKRQFLVENYDYVRRSLMCEPRGHKDMFGVFVTPPFEPGSDAGMLWMDGERFVEMCGHGTIALSMVMVSQGLAKNITLPITKLQFETPAGIVTSEVQVNGENAEWCRFQNVPAFVLEQDIPVELPDYGLLKADIAFGGNFFAVIQWPDETRKISPENGTFLSRMGQLVKKQINEKINVVHPTKKHIRGVHFCTFWHESDNPSYLYRNVHVFSDGKLDRSPGGTGTSMMMAVFEARNKIEIGQKIKSEGLLGSGTFEGCLIGETKVGDLRAVIPTVKGSAKITGFAKWLLDPEDVVGQGFVIY
ncbi:MAG: 4-hydroxyproline 2-epimerase [Alphaproteobacteria bacterium MarineAlpha3_Bin5]|nr:proline racemase [Magnetovibrio sp.]PPR80002.1 MAG: 4-hydroxyproline 2-epimerase [Alphaproteobacteria bacterium MarineAlpha3_Bin5]